MPGQLLIWILVGQWLLVLVVSAGGGYLDILYPLQTALGGYTVLTSFRPTDRLSVLLFATHQIFK